MGDVRDAYASRLKDAQADQKKQDQKGAWLAHGRVITFIGIVVFAALAVFQKLPGYGWWLSLASLVSYILLAWVHDKVIRAEERAKTRAALNQRGLDRLEGKWHAFAEKGDRFASGDHLYTADLDVFGQGSLFQLVDETATRAGEETLAAWLSAPAAPDVVRARQEAVKELAPLVDFRQSLLVESRIASKEKANPGQFVKWAEGGPYLQSIRWAVPLAFILPPLTLALFLLGREEVLPRWSWLGGLFLLLGVVGLTRKPLAQMYEQMTAGERGFVRFADTFAVVEAQRFKAPLLIRVLGPLQAEGDARVSAKLKRFQTRFSFAEARQSSQLHAVLNLLTLWDLHWMFALERWRAAYGKEVRQWFAALSELEALCSLATLAHDRPDHTFPEVDDGPSHFEATGLGHPLLDAPVKNDVALTSPGAALIVTGSNMSGKTTLLRAMGANAVLALAGAPVNCTTLRLSTMKIITSMRVKDSLERGVSYFYAEVQRIRSVLDTAKAAGGKALFLLDEILLGTNTRERQMASKEILRQLLLTGAIGAVTTHDLALTQVEGRDFGHVRNVHFRDVLVDGRMTFDYRMREGVVQTTNALRVLAEAGVPVGESEVRAE